MGSLPHSIHTIQTSLLFPFLLKDFKVLQKVCTVQHCWNTAASGVERQAAYSIMKVCFVAWEAVLETTAMHTWDPENHPEHCLPVFHSSPNTNMSCADILSNPSKCDLWSPFLRTKQETFACNGATFLTILAGNCVPKCVPCPLHNLWQMDKEK